MEKRSGAVRFRIPLRKGEKLTSEHVKDSLLKLAMNPESVKKLQDQFSTPGDEPAMLLGTKKQGT